MKNSGTVYCKNINFLLKAEFEHRQLKNSLYSLRAFARDLNITVSSLHGYLKDQKKPSISNIKEFCRSLKLSDEEAKFYYTPVKDIDLINGVKNFNETGLDSDEEDDVEIANSDVYHLAYFGLYQLDGFENSIEWISKKLNLSTERVTEIEQRLLNLSRLKLNEEGRPVRNYKPKNVSIRKGVTKLSEAKKLEKSRSQMMIESMDRYSKDELAHSFVFFSSNKEKILEAKQRVQNFKIELATLMEQTEVKSDLYCLSINLNPVT